MNRGTAIDKISRAFDDACSTMLELDCRRFEETAKPTPAEARAFRDWRRAFLQSWKRSRVQLVIMGATGSCMLTNATPTLQ
jgi:hypothetical protein